MPAHTLERAHGAYAAHFSSLSVMMPPAGSAAWGTEHERMLKIIGLCQYEKDLAGRLCARLLGVKMYIF